MRSVRVNTKTEGKIVANTAEGIDTHEQTSFKAAHMAGKKINCSLVIVACLQKRGYPCALESFPKCGRKARLSGVRWFCFLSLPKNMQKKRAHLRVFRPKSPTIYFSEEAMRKRAREFST